MDCDKIKNMKRPQFAVDQIYHIYNRGVEKREIFSEDKDRFRFIHDLFEFNDKMPAGRFSEVQPPKVLEVRNRNLMVEILAFCLMPNHFHLLLREKTENGIVGFMQKLGTGYAMYFNQKYQRVGSLFQGRFKAVLIDKENHFLYLPYYIHANPLDLIVPQWKDKRIEDLPKAIHYLENYRWSSYLDYIGRDNFPSIISKSFLEEVWGGQGRHKANTEDWLKSLSLEEIQSVVIE